MTVLELCDISEEPEKKARCGAEKGFARLGEFGGRKEREGKGAANSFEMLAARTQGVIDIPFCARL